MTRYSKRFWLLGAATSGLAGYIDAIGFLKLGGLFVSFMSGNSTRLAVGLVTEAPVAGMAAGLVAAFVGGVWAGTMVSAMTGAWRKPAAMTGVSILLAAAAATNSHMAAGATAALLAAAMGMANTVFQRDGEVSVGVTYMTGALVKFAQRLATAMLGGPRWAWLPYLMLWCGLVAGALVGALVYPRYGTVAIAAAAGGASLLTLYAAWLGPADRRPVRQGAPA